MTNIDQFESVFKAADKTPFALESVRIGSVMVVTGLAQAEANEFDRQAHAFVGSLGGSTDLGWHLVTGDEFAEVDELLQLIDEHQPDLICAYRNLQTPAPDLPYSLGVFVDVLTQATKTPVLLLPTPTRLGQRQMPLGPRNAVMAITDHLTGDHHLVSWASFFTESGGKLFLSHVEDEATYERYVNAIAKIPAIDTETARATILAQLLKEPHDYIGSCRQILQQANRSVQVEEIVTVGHRMADYQRLVDEHHIKLLVMNTKDDDQLAMHGLAYPLAVELREVPLLLL